MEATEAKSWSAFSAYAARHVWKGEASTVARRPHPVAGTRFFQLTADESERFLRIVSEAALVANHCDFHNWLSGDVQLFMPHEILIGAWGDFAKGDVKVDITSGLPGVRTSELARCGIDSLIKEAHALWAASSYRPAVKSVRNAHPGDCGCRLHEGLSRMRSIVVHGVRDERGGGESIYIALSSASITRGRPNQRFASIMDLLVPQIDVACRRLKPYRLERPSPTKACRVLELSGRERQIIESVCQGQRNVDIAAALQISPFTVKNHVRRIFRKIGVTNRTQAAARYMEAVRQAALQLASEPAAGAR